MVDMMCQQTAAGDGGGGGGNVFGVAYFLVLVSLVLLVFFLRTKPFLLSLLRFVLTLTSLCSLLLLSFAQAASHSLRLETVLE
jgi:hypothetical protein